MKHKFILAGAKPVSVVVDVVDSTPEGIVLKVLESAEGFLTKKDIIDRVEAFGYHKAFESYTSMATSMRNMQQILRDLRDWGVPIISTTKGVKVADSVEEVVDYCNWLQKKRKAKQI